MKLLDVKFCPFANAAPQYGSALVVHFQHMAFGFFAGITKHPLEHHGDVGHEVDRIVMDNHLPRHIQFVFVPGLCFPCWSFNGGSGTVFDLHAGHD